MQKFLSDTAVSRYIKALLYNTYVPKYKSVFKDDIIVKDTKYVYKNNIILCTSTGTLLGTGKYKTVADYNQNVGNRKICDNFMSKESYYDSTTHIKLGDFLRFYRSLTEINLLPLYNCFSNVYSSSFSITADGISSLINPLVKIAAIPIKFNTTYTIALDSSSDVMLAPALLDGGDFLFVNDVNITNLLYETEKVIHYPSLNFLSPKTYRLDNTDPFMQKYEKGLVLFIQMSNNCDSSLVVLEGDYTNTSRKIINVEKVVNKKDKEDNPIPDYYGLRSLSDEEKDYIFTSDLSLLRMNDRCNYAFSDKLILYLLASAITSEEDIYNNILRVQEAINAEDYYAVIPDVWDDRLRKILFDSYVDNKEQSIDILGYVDNDMEKFLSEKKGK